MRNPTRDQNKFIVRMPPGLRPRIMKAAKTNNRSMNAEIVARLEASFKTKHLTEELRAFVKGLVKELK